MTSRLLYSIFNFRVSKKVKSVMMIAQNILILMWMTEESVPQTVRNCQQGICYPSVPCVFVCLSVCTCLCVFCVSVCVCVCVCVETFHHVR
jgi:hypothetical protein